MPVNQVGNSADQPAQPAAVMFGAAREVLGRGWIPVPLHPGTKRPSMDWADPTDWIDDLATVRKVWGKGGTHEGHGVGVLTGPSKLNVLDLDVKHDGEGALAELGHRVEATLRRRTPSGGVHGYYRAQAGQLPTASGRIAPGIDTRGKGGMVAWAVPHATYETVEDLEPADTPTWLYDAAGALVERAFRPKEFRSVDSARLYVERSLAALRNAVEGERNEKVRDAALCVGHFGDEFWDLDEAREMVLEAATFCGADTEPDTEPDTAATLRSALRDARTQGTHTLAARTAGESDLDWRLVSGADFILNTPEQTPAVWGTGDQVLWAEGEPLIITGPTGVGKTTLGAQLVLGRLGQLDRLLGFDLAEGRKVLYLACDRPKQIARALRRSFRDVDPAVLNERLVFQAGPPPRDLARNPEMLLELAQRVGADTVVIDSIKDVAVKLSDEETGQGLHRAFQLCIAADIEVVAYHHQRKQGGGTGDSKPRTIDAMYGSAWIAAGAGSVVLIWGAAGDSRVELVHLKQPADKVGPLNLRHDHANGTTSIVGGVDLWELVVGAGDVGLTVRRAVELIEQVDEPGDALRERYRRLLDGLVERGLAEKHTPRGKPAVYRPLTRCDGVT